MLLYVKNCKKPGETLEIRCYGTGKWEVVKLVSGKELYKYLVKNEEEALAYYYKIK